MSHRRARKAVSLLAATCITVVGLIAAAPANATISSVFPNAPAPINCAVQGNGVRLCDQTVAGNNSARTTVPSFDGIPLDVRVAFPPEPVSGPDGPYPLIMLFHGYAGSKLGLSTMQPFLDRGYATFSMSTRGFGESCGTFSSRSAPECANGYVRLMDTRYEVRDAQDLAGQLADQGVTSPTQIGSIGGSYGGGMSMALAALKDRKMLTDGSLTAWQSPNGTPMQIAAAAPQIPWTDIAYSLLPNGSTLDYVADAPYQGRSGVLKQSFENGLFLNGSFNGYYADEGLDPDADLRGWHTLFTAGEPYDDANGNPLPAIAAVRDKLTTYHSSYYIDHSQSPAPMFISSGWTDDLFPPDEAIRFYNRTRTQYPGTDISMFFASLGHQRGQNKAADIAVRSAAELDWLDYYVKGVGSRPFQGVTGIAQTCPNTAPSGAPYSVSDWAHFGPGEVRIDGAAPQTIIPGSGSISISGSFDPITGPGACATTAGADQAGTANYRSSPLPAGGVTLAGSPTVVADITSPGSNSQIAARLLDVNPAVNGTQTLIARGLWRPAITSTPRRQVFQLHPNMYNFAAGHVLKLELLPRDGNYGRTSNGQQNVTVQNLQLRMPVQEQPGAAGGLVQVPLPKVVPAGHTLAAPFQPSGYARPKAATPIYASLVPAYEPCTSPNRTHAPPLSIGSCNPPALESGDLTFGTPDANLKSPNFVGFAKLRVVTGDPSTLADEADVAIDVSLTDVRRQTDLSDYTGELSARPAVQLTDGANGSAGDGAGTTQEFEFPVVVPCAATPDPDIGGQCSVSTTFDAVAPGATTEGTRAIWELGAIAVHDGGADGLAGTGPNAVLARQGVFAP